MHIIYVNSFHAQRLPISNELLAPITTIYHRIGFVKDFFNMKGEVIELETRIPVEQRDYFYSDEVRARNGNITPVTLSRWVREKGIPCRQPGKCMLFDKGPYLRWEKDQNFKTRIESAGKETRNADGKKNKRK